MMKKVGQFGNQPNIKKLSVQCDIQNVVRSASNRKPWNWGKRKSVEDDCGNKWCNCVEPKLVSNGGERGQAYCLLCGKFWYH